MIEIKLLPGSKVEIAGEISAGDFMNCKDQADLERMAIIALQKEYFKIIKTRKIKAIGRPEIVIAKITKDNSLAYKIRTAVLPENEATQKS
jgi:FKBP-type peptidyl-prolyl cis-trans isomerase (trigger factor)